LYARALTYARRVTITRSVLALAAVALFADVAPRCGGKRGVTVHPAAPWTPCDPKGPHEFKCEPPTSCFYLSPDFDPPGRGQVCTKECTTEADCTFMGADFACNGRATSGAGAPPARVCAKRAQDSGKD
jgi:hypothetical protein